MGMNIVRIFDIFSSLFIHMFILGIVIIFFPMFGPCIRRIQPTFLAVSVSLSAPSLQITDDDVKYIT